MTRSYSKALRLTKIPELLELKPRTTKELAEYFGVPQRTIQRDIQLLLEEGHALESPERGVYQVNSEATVLSAVEALAMHAAGRLLFHHSPTKNRAYQKALEKLALTLPEPAKAIAIKSAEDLQVRPDDRTTELAARAWFGKNVLRFSYYTPGEPDKLRVCELEIYLLEVNRQNLAMYAVGRERATYNAVLTFKLARMTQTYILDDTYTVPETFKPSNYLSSAWGIMGLNSVTVKLKFSALAAARIKEGGYPNLSISVENTDGSLEVTIEAGADPKGFPTELLPWVQSWGPRVEVLAPTVLRERWLAEAAEVALHHPHLKQLASVDDAPEMETTGMDNYLSKEASVLWAKSTDDDQGYSLIGHLLDVAAVTWELLEREPRATKQLYAQDLGLELNDVSAWVSALVGLHDIGKATPSFQSLWSPGLLLVQATGLPIRKQPGGAPHGQLSQIILTRELEAFGLYRRTPQHIADALGAHHGTRTSRGTLREVPQNTDIGNEAWQAVQQELFTAVLKTLGVLMLSIPKVAKLPGAALVRLGGLTSFADWIGSDITFFPTERSVKNPEAHYADARKRARNALQILGWEPRTALSSDPPSFEHMYPEFAPRDLQMTSAKLVANTSKPTLLIVEAPMGEGKTEAAFHAHVTLQSNLGHRGMYVALPTQATGNAMFERTKALLESFERDTPPDLQLLHGASLINDSYTSIQVKDVGGVNQEENAVWARSWFTNKKRALLSEYGVGTVDQSLLSVLETKHHFVRLWGLANRTVVIDEVHAYELYTSKLIERLVMWLGSLGSSVIILSATLPSTKRRALVQAFGGEDDADLVPYPRITQVVGKTTHSHTFSVREQQPIALESAPLDSSELALLLLGLTAEGGCAVGIVNTVARAQQLYEALGEGVGIEGGKKLLDGTEVYLFHARYPARARQQREKIVLSRFSKAGKRPERSILIGTQVLEQSLDLDFDVMLTDLAPVDLLLQRAGRMHRHERTRPAHHQSPVLYISGLSRDDSLPDISTHYHDLIYDAYVLLMTWLVLKNRQHISLPDDFEPLIEAVYTESIPVGVTPIILEALETALEKQEAELKDHSDKARDVVIKKPEVYPDGPNDQKGRWLEVDEDDPSVHKDVRPTTRLGEPSITVIPLHKRGTKLYLESGFQTEVDIETKSAVTWDAAKSIYLEHVKLSRKELVYGLLDKAVPAWQKHPLLRYSFPLVFENGVATVGKLRVTYSEQLGLLYEKS